MPHSEPIIPRRYSTVETEGSCVPEILPDKNLHPAHRVFQRAAARNGRDPGDRRRLDVILPAADKLPATIRATRGRSFNLVVLRHGRRVTVGPVRAKIDQGVYRIGIAIEARARFTLAKNASALSPVHVPCLRHS